MDNLLREYWLQLITIIFCLGGLYHRFKTFPVELALKANKETVDNLLTQFNSFQTSLNNAALQHMAKPGSPLKLTEYAEKVLLDIEFNEKIFPHICDSLLQELEKYEMRTPYDVQEKSQFVVRSKRDDPLYDEMKKAIYRTGNNLDEILAAIWIPLRDYYLQKHPEILD